MIHLIIEDRENALNYIPLIRRHLPHLAINAIKHNLNTSGYVTSFDEDKICDDILEEQSPIGDFLNLIKTLQNSGAQIKFIEQTDEESGDELPLNQLLNYVERAREIANQIERENELIIRG
ncbi:hypothetical protein HV213_26325 [Klebsiella sp. RHBSTW-00484]|uniref:hypothetical protein n=1 Tax=unclassified Klebsiella TaxID=2608929 RepID=UPI0015E58EF5|nr:MULTISPECIES: hypothetical protein [unclassified Klebsiella]MBA7843737.1 hypothetical protein [Klebsiella sp. RHBSTW-00465]QLO39090.1 hypothetical protein HV213_26325 [Klebsiella sp. RHBSTW-00484]QLT78610.1 hypothetical protein HV204_26325 [Klebsiella sp. RHBSTW-00464]